MGRKREWTNEQIAQIKDLYEVQGKSIDAIHYAMGVHKTTLYRAVDYLGLKKRPKATEGRQVSPEVDKMREKIKALWMAGASLNGIAIQMTKTDGHTFTRNMVLGHIRRMKLPQRTKDACRQEGRSAAKQRPHGFAMPLVAGLGLSVAKDKTPPVFMGDDGHPEPLGPVGDFPPGRTTCRYIHGDVTSSSWRCCGHNGFPWCETHEKRFTVPSTGKSNVDQAMLRKSGIARALG